MNYPNNIRKTFVNKISHSNRGMTLENMINESNTYYKNNDIALIYKKPTPIGVVDVAYENNKKVIKKAYFKEQSTLDYNGLYKGKYLDFDAKECLNKTSFPLDNIHEHQKEHIINVIKHQGIAFLIIKMNNKIFLFDGQDYLDYINNTTRKSIEYSYIEEKGLEIKEGYIPRLDYIKAVDEKYFKGE